MKIVTVFGTRPEIFRLSQIIPLLDQFCTHILVHTGQNFDKNLSDIFFNELKIRKADYYLGIRAGTIGDQIGKVLSGCEKVFKTENPDKVLILGDTNSALCSIIAKRMGIPIYHMEAGNRCFDDRVPEEVNRRIIDHFIDILLPYTERNRMNLIMESISNKKIFVTGNPIFKVIAYYTPEISLSQIIENLGLIKFKYFILTVHRAENVDNPKRLKTFLSSINQIQKKYGLPIIVSTHLHTRDRMSQMEHFYNLSVQYLELLGLLISSLLRNMHFVSSVIVERSRRNAQY
jgi:UDP-N-acetylglucosamine 2-epimerase (non-hydrolysing)